MEKYNKSQLPLSIHNLRLVDKQKNVFHSLKESIITIDTAKIKYVRFYKPISRIIVSKKSLKNERL